jgi:hypothetical protein
MNKYYIKNRGCDDTTEFEIELTDEELKTVIRLFEENNKNASYGCMPDIYVYEFREDNHYYGDDVKALNKSYDELKGKSE